MGASEYGTFCIPQTTASTIGIVAAAIVHGFIWLILATWIDGTSQTTIVILYGVSCIAVIYYWYRLAVIILRMSRKSYATKLVQDIEYGQAWMGLLGYLSAGLLHFFYTLAKTQATFAADPMATVVLYAIHLYFAFITFLILARSLFDFASYGVDLRRSAVADTDSDDPRVLYGFFPPMTYSVILSLIALLTLHVTALLCLLNVFDGTATNIIGVFNYVALGLGILYVIILVLQWSQRQKRLLRLARDLELAHCLSGLLFLLSCALVHAIFTARYTPADFASDVILNGRLAIIHLYFIVGTLMLVTNTLFNMTAKGTEERRISETGN